MLRLSLACLVLIGFCSVPTFAASMGELATVIEPETDASWSVTSGPKGVQLRNRQAPGDLRYYYVNAQPERVGKRSVELDVAVLDAGADALGGLLYGLQQNPLRYFLFVVGTDGSASLFYRGDEGLERRLQSNVPAAADGFNHLKLVERGQQITLWANGSELGAIENSQLGLGAVGIAAADTGTFRFANFSISGPAAAGAVATPDSNRSKRPVRPVSAPAPVKVASSNYRMHDYMDQSLGMVQRRIPLPAGWRLDDNPNDLVHLLGPDRIVAYQTGSEMFVASDDPFVRQSAQIGGKQAAPVPAIAGYLQQRFAQTMSQRGFELTKHYPMPRVQEFWERFGAAMPKTLSRRRYEALGAEWRHRDGSRAYTILVLHVLMQSNMQLWNVAGSEVYSPGEHFEYARQTLTHVATRTQVNPQWQIAMNNQLIAKLRADRTMSDQRLKQAQIAHAQRMNAILEQGQTSRRIARINSEILDSSHASYLRQSDMVTRGNQRFNQMIHEQSVITNRETGEMYEVDAGYGHHWVSSEGIHLATENSLYDPRTDGGVNHAEWSRFEVMR